MLLILWALSFSPSPAGFSIHRRRILFETYHLPSAGSCPCTQSSYCRLYPSHNEDVQLQFSKIHLKTAELSQILKRPRSTSSIIYNQWFTDSLSSFYWLCSNVIAFRRLVRSDLFWVRPNIYFSEQSLPHNLMHIIVVRHQWAPA